MRNVKSSPRFYTWFFVFIGLLLVIRLLLPVLIKKKINEELSRLPDYTGHVEGVHLALWRGGVALKDLTLTHRHRDLSLVIKTMSLRLSWHELLRHVIVVDLRVDSPRLRMLVKRPSQAVKKTKEESREVNHVVKEKTGESLPDVLAGLIPFRINSFTLTDGSIRLREEGQDLEAEAEKDVSAKKNAPEGQEKESGLEARVSNIQISIHNLTNTSKQSGTLMATGEASAQVMNEGQVHLTIRLDPTAHEPKFYLGIEIRRLDLTSLNPILRWQWGIDAKRGTFELYSESAAADGHFKGYIKPLIQNLKMVDIKRDKGAVKIIKEAIVGAVASVFSNSQKDQVGTKVPFEGQFENPHAGIWEAILEVLRNAFIEALKPKLDRTVKLSDVSHS